MKTFVSYAASLELHMRPDAHLLLTRPCPGMNFDVQVIRFTSRLALESFNRKANLHAVVKTQVPKNCVIYKHQSDSDDESQEGSSIDALTRLTTNKEKFAIVSDPSNPKNWGIIWEDSGTEAGFFDEVTARRSALLQDGMEADPEESRTWVW